MLQRSRRLTAAVNLDCFSSITALKSEKFRKSRAIFSTRPVTHDVKSTSSSTSRVYLYLFGFLGVSSALLYWSRKKKIFPVVNSPVKRCNFLAEAVKKAMPAVVHIEKQVSTSGNRRQKN